MEPVCQGFRSYTKDLGDPHSLNRMLQRWQDDVVSEPFVLDCFQSLHFIQWEALYYL
jgi:hypothetical protein